MDALTIRNTQEIRAAQGITPALFTAFTSYIDRCEKTTRTYLTNLRQFWAWLLYTDTRNPQRTDIISYREWLTAEHDAIRLTGNGWEYRTDSTGEPVKVRCKPNTIAQYLRSVCSFFRWTAAENLYPNVAENIHAPKVSHDNHRKEALTAAEVLDIESSIARNAQEATARAAEADKDQAGRMQRSTEQGKRLYAMYLLAVNAGLRTIEINRANCKDFVTKGGKAWLYIWGKGHTEPDQKKPLAPEVATAIREYLKSRTDSTTGNSPLFVSTGNRSHGKRIATTTISTMLKKAMQAAGYDSERLTAHSLRHSAAMAALNVSGNNIYTAQKYLRHANANTTGIYLHETEETERTDRETAESVYSYYHGGADQGTGSGEKLQAILATLTAEQIEKLTGIAAAMA